MTSSNGNIFRITGFLCGEYTSHRWIPREIASDAELWYFLWSAPEPTSWANKGDASDLRHHCAPYDVIVMLCYNCITLHLTIVMAEPNLIWLVYYAPSYLNMYTFIETGFTLIPLLYQTHKWLWLSFNNWYYLNYDNWDFSNIDFTIHIENVVLNFIRPISQIPQCIRQISHNVPFCNRNVHMRAHFC